MMANRTAWIRQLSLTRLTAPPRRRRSGVFATPGDPTATAPLRVLLAEDNVVNQRVAVGLLGRRGHTVTVANNGLEAIAATEGTMVDDANLRHVFGRILEKAKLRRIRFHDLRQHAGSPIMPGRRVA
jgi:hypothetical protein